MHDDHERITHKKKGKRQKKSSFKKVLRVLKDACRPTKREGGISAFAYILYMCVVYKCVTILRRKTMRHFNLYCPESCCT